MSVMIDLAGDIFGSGVIAYSISSFAYTLLVLLMATSWRGRLQGALLLSACVFSALWALLVAIHAAYGYPSSISLSIVELLRNGLWLWFILRLLVRQVTEESSPVFRGMLGLAVYGLVGFFFLLLFVHLIEWGAGGEQFTLLGRFVPGLLGHLLLAIVGLVLIEQVFRNTLPEQRWAIKFLCVGLGISFAYDFYLYSDAVLLGRLDPDLWDARGFVQALIVPMIGISVARNPQWSLDVFVSRKVVFHSVTILAVGSYLLIMAAGGYFIRYWGGEWGAVAQVFFFFGSVIVLFVLLFSGQLRARARVLLSKHFFSYRYDYRKEWLDLTDKLSSERQAGKLRVLVIQALSGFVGSKCGLLWLKRENGSFSPSGSWNVVASKVSLSADSSLVRFLEKSKWIIDLDEYYEVPEMYDGLRLDPWLTELGMAWLVVPLIQHDGLLGFVVLGHSDVSRAINWEERDLLKTAGSQAAGYLSLVEASEALIDARQFDAFNRLSAYVVHDLKNVVGQLSLVVNNAKKHKNNPNFVDDAFITVDNSVAKMQRMLGQLRGSQRGGNACIAVKLDEVISDVEAHSKKLQPCLTLGKIDHVTVVADKDRLISVVQHIVDNAQEATPDDGYVRLSLRKEGGNGAILKIEDSGCGMSDDFIHARLFRPFDTTKGNAGMGVGVYECLDFMRSLGGDVEVESVVGKGTIFRLIFPFRDSE